MKALAIVLFISTIAIAGCQRATPIASSDNYDAEADQLDAEGNQLEKLAGASPYDARLPSENIQIVDGVNSQIRLLPIGSLEQRAQLASYVSQSGLSCPSVTAAFEAIQNHQGQDVFKIECSDGNVYQATIIGNKSYLKAWTGTLLGN